MKMIVTVIGARPQFIKMALVSHVLKEKRIKEIIVHTGQHYDENMSDIFFKEFQIPIPDYNLRVGSDSQGVQTARMLMGIEKILLKEKPQLVVVYGDTNSTLAGALAAAKLNISVAHVESGLRSYNRNMPEEINRLITDRLASILFCPTKTSVYNLKKEGIAQGVYLTGDVMYDLIKRHVPRSGSANVDKGKYILCTIHRSENTDSKSNLKNIFTALSRIKGNILLPVHPRTKKMLKVFKINIPVNVKMLNPLGYMDMLTLERNAMLIITDSGGVQKEAFIFNVPCITLRNETEWVETVESGMNVIVGTSVDRILSAVKKASKTKKRINAEEFYGNGAAYEKITNIIEKKLDADK